MYKVTDGRMARARRSSAVPDLISSAINTNAAAMLLSTVKKLKKLSFTKLPRVTASWNCAVSATMMATLVARRTYDRTDEYPVLNGAIVLFHLLLPGDHHAWRNILCQPTGRIDTPSDH